MNYKKLPLLAIVIFFPFSFLLAQHNEFTVKGWLMDSTSKQALSYATVSLKPLTGGNQRSALTKEDGSFIIEKVPAGKYEFIAMNVGFKKISMPLELNEKSNAVTDMGKLFLSNQANQLQGVEVTTERPLVKQEVDRIIYDVQSDPESKFETALDMLRKVPLVSLDADDNIQVKGSANFKVLINGKTSSLVARSPKDVFKAMPASSIVRIEVITNPPAKYDAEGIAGIINVITTQNIESGYNGTFGSWYNYPWGPGFNASLTLKQNKFAVSAYYGNGWGIRVPYTEFSYSRTGFDPATQLNQNGKNKNGWEWYYMQTELSYEFDTLNLLTGEISYNPGANNYTSYQSSFLYNSDGSLAQSYDMQNLSNGGWNGLDLGLNYQHTFKRNKEQLLTLSYKNSFGSDFNASEITTSNEFNYTELPYKQKNESGTGEQTYQIDYTHPVKNVDIEAGVKAITRNNFSDYEFKRFDPSINDYMIDDTQTNEFDYQQNVYSFYNSYNIKLKDWGFKLGARIEQTIVDADFQTTSTTVNQDYSNIIPSVSIQRKFKDMSSVNVGYTQRIQRPSIWELNPYVDQTNPKFISYGNPNLEAVLSHNIELGYSIFKKGSINLGSSYSFSDNTIQNITTLGADTITRSTYENVGKEKRLGMNGNTNFPINNKLTLNVNALLSYVWLNGAVNGEELSNEGVQGNAFGSLSYMLPKDFKIRMNGGYYSKLIQLQGQTNSFGFYGLTLSKDFWKKQATVSASIRNPFRKYRYWKQDYKTDEYVQNTTYQNMYRSFGVSFNYRFGKLQNGVKKNERGINNDDVEKKSSGGGGGQ